MRCDGTVVVDFGIFPGPLTVVASKPYTSKVDSLLIDSQLAGLSPFGTQT